MVPMVMEAWKKQVNMVTVETGLAFLLFSMLIRLFTFECLMLVFSACVWWVDWMCACIL